jgi:hypothetical protein
LLPHVSAATFGDQDEQARLGEKVEGFADRFDTPAEVIGELGLRHEKVIVAAFCEAQAEIVDCDSAWILA